MLRQMLVAVDLSPWSHHAAQHACDVSRAIGGTVTLVHVLEDHESGPLGQEAARALLQRLSLLARQPPGCLIVPALNSWTGPQNWVDRSTPGKGVAPAILAVAEQLGADLIVIGLHGERSPASRTIGRVARQVLMDARVPVQVVPSSVPARGTHRWSATLVEHSAR